MMSTGSIAATATKFASHTNLPPMQTGEVFLPGVGSVSPLHGTLSLQFYVLARVLFCYLLRFEINPTAGVPFRTKTGYTLPAEAVLGRLFSRQCQSSFKSSFLFGQFLLYTNSTLRLVLQSCSFHCAGVSSPVNRSASVASNPAAP